MKILVVGDVHFSQYSSIVRSRGKNFSTRLENMIQSLNWVEQVSKEYGCEEEIFLGDFFDRPDLNSEEITALSEIEWNHSSRLKHFIVGNHESGIASLVYNSTQSLHRFGAVEDTPYIYSLDEKTEILFLPYITEDDRKPFAEYLTNRNPAKKLIVFSHNDIKDFQMGAFLSTTGFSVDEIGQYSDLYMNGHLHNCGQVSDKIINVGNLTGQNFSEDAFKYEHHIAILDTDTMKIEYVENPYAMNFYKIEINSESDIKELKKIKSNAVLHIRCLDTLENVVRSTLETLNVIASKIILVSTASSGSIDSSVSLKCADHLKQFIDFILSRDDIDDKEIFRQELSEVCGQ